MNPELTHLLGDSRAAQAAARQILAESRFHQPGVPRPLHGALTELGHLIQAPLNGLDSLVTTIAAIMPGGVPGVWALFALLVVVAAVLASTRAARRGLRSTGPERVESGALDPRELERLATAAQNDGRFDEAVRLRFRAGLLGLAERDLISRAPTRPTVEISRALGSPRFDALARRFDEIAYGSRPATVDDLDQQRREWPRILRSPPPEATS